MTTVTIGQRDFRDWITPLLGSVGTDDMLPVLTYVRVQSAGGYLVGMSSDRFRATMHRVAVEMDGPDFAHNLPAVGIKRLLKVFLAGKRDMKLTLTFGDDGLTVAGDDVSMTVAYGEGLYPDVAGLFGNALERDNADGPREFSVNPVYLSTPAKVVGPAATVIVPATEASPVILRIGDDYLHLIMPRRQMKGDAPDSDATPWTDLIKEMTK